jgi:uncharacterized membrane protein YtjA (UPF0391 family)
VLEFEGGAGCSWIFLEKYRSPVRIEPEGNQGGKLMLRWALIFFVVALIAAILGFSGIAVASAGIAKVLFYVFLVLFVVSLLSHTLGGRSV